MSDGWIPTAQLRFIERVVTVDPGPPPIGRIVRILQQAWECTAWACEDEWRDVPLVTHETEAKP
jgi:hypothetical protein